MRRRPLEEGKAKDWQSEVTRSSTFFSLQINSPPGVLFPPHVFLCTQAMNQRMEMRGGSRIKKKKTKDELENSNESSFQSLFTFNLFWNERKTELHKRKKNKLSTCFIGTPKSNKGNISLIPKLSFFLGLILQWAWKGMWKKEGGREKRVKREKQREEMWIPNNQTKNKEKKITEQQMREGWKSKSKWNGTFLRTSSSSFRLIHILSVLICLQWSPASASIAIPAFFFSPCFFFSASTQP